MIGQDLAIDLDQLTNNLVEIVEETPLEPLGDRCPGVREAQRLEQGVNPRRLNRTPKLGDKTQRRLQLPLEALIAALVLLGLGNALLLALNEVLFIDIGSYKLMQEPDVLGSECEQNVVVEVGGEDEFDRVVLLRGAEKYLRAWQVKDLLVLGLLADFGLLGEFGEAVGVLAERREVAEADGVDVAVGVLEPLVDGLEASEDVLRVVVDEVDGGHVTLALVGHVTLAQVEAQVLLLNHFLVALLCAQIINCVKKIQFVLE